MTNYTRGIFIDANNQKVSMILLNSQYLLKELYEAIGCSYVERIPLTNDHDLIIDEEGRLKDGNLGFKLDGTLIVGNAIILGVDEADWVDCKIPLRMVETHVAYLNKEEVKSLIEDDFLEVKWI